MLEKTLFISDLDGTLLNEKKILSPYTVSTLEKLINNGIKFSYATAREYVSSRSITSFFNFKAPVIVGNGTYIMDVETDKPLIKNLLTKNDISDIRAMFADLHYTSSPLIFSRIGEENKILWNMQNSDIYSRFPPMPNEKRFLGVASDDEAYVGDISSVTLIDSKENLQPLYQSFSQNPNLTCVFSKNAYDDNYFFYIMSCKADKDKALLQLKELLDCERIVCFGDEANDISMFKIADECYAVANAIDEIKSMATEIIPANYEDGVAVWLNNNIMEEISERAI